jgi:O-antigen/teichoic acid export membrane protein
VGIDTVTAWWTSINIVLLSKLTNENDVGLYNAANQLMVPLAIFCQSVMVAAFPIMCRKFSMSGEGLKRISNRLIELLMIVAIPGTVGLIMVAAPALEFVYKKESFVQAADVVRITAAILILKALTYAMGHVLLAGSREITTLRIVIVDLIVGLFLGLILISLFGLIGAAVAALLTRIVDFAQHFQPVRNIVANFELKGVFWHPSMASLAMALFLYLVRDGNLAFNIVAAGKVYFATLIALESWSIGGIRKLPARYFS